MHSHSMQMLKFLSTLPARGATRFAVAAWYMFPKFLSTLPARGATLSLSSRLLGARNFYPRSPRGERLGIGRVQV